jgi:hypothetical protein
LYGPGSSHGKPRINSLIHILEEQKEGKNEKDLDIHNYIDDTDSLHNHPDPGD